MILHLYDWSASDDLKKAEVRARREFEALHRLQRHSWAPRIIDSFQDVRGYPGEIAFFTVADPSAPSIAERANDKSWDSAARLGFARSAIRALAELHETESGGEPMLHRNLTPKTVLVRHDNAAVLTGFEHARIPTQVTVASSPSATEWDEAAAPEVRVQGRGAADRRSDTYSLCASLQVLFAGREDDDSRAAERALAGGAAHEPDARSTLVQLDAALSELLGEDPPAPPPPPARYWTEDQVVRFEGHDYRIVARLGSGGVGTTFKVVEIDRRTKEDLGTYVAKVVHEGETADRVLRTHRLVRSHLRHSALSTVYQVASEWQDNAITVLMTWIEGERLGEYTGLIKELADDYGKESRDALVVRWLRTTCEALGELHASGLVHGDISPRNLILSGSDLVLTDYDCVTKIGEPSAVPGTVMYCSPRADGHVAAPSDDLYALAASMFHVLLAREPFRRDGDLAKERGLNWTGVERADFPVLSAFLDRATDPDRDRRFTRATAALQALAAASSATPRPDDSTSTEGEAERETEQPRVQRERTENEVAWLRDVLQSYPGSRWGNRETRGLDSEFADRTYVETKLEQALYRDLQNGNVSLVVLCGNAGDGKTALLQRLAQRLDLGDHKSSRRILEGQTPAGLTVRMNLDGSASWEGRTSDQLLDEFLEPFQHGRPSENIAHLLAINDGRLLEWIEDHEQSQGGPTPLTQSLTTGLDGGRQREHDAHVRFVDLNQRSLVGAVTPDRTSIETGFLDRLVDALYGGKESATIWAPCQTCSAQHRCEVLRATRLFAPDSRADERVRSRVRQRLFEALQAVHLRGETHITVRELRAALVYILFGVHFCSDYHSGEHTDALAHWDRAFDPQSPGRQGEVLRELARFDPALDAHPHIDRALLHPSTIAREFNGPGFLDASRGAAERRARLVSERRRAYFEWPESRIESLAGDPDALGLAQGRHLSQFRDLTIVDNASRDRLAARLCEGISRLEALPPQALNRSGAVPLRITPRTPTETAFWVEKRASDFRLEVELPGTPDLDRLHRHAKLIYRYRNGSNEELLLGAELFHLLLELADGYQLGDVATDGTFAHLSIFVQRLVREDERRVLAWSPMADEAVFEVAAEHGASGRRQTLAIGRRDPGDWNGETG